MTSSVTEQWGWRGDAAKTGPGQRGWKDTPFLTQSWLLGQDARTNTGGGSVGPEPAHPHSASGHGGARDPLLKLKGAIRPPGKTDTRWAGPGNSWGGGLTEAPSGEPSRAWGWAPARPLHGGERRLLRRSENIIFMDPGVGGSHRVCACHRFKCLHVVTEAPS